MTKIKEHDPKGLSDKATGIRGLNIPVIKNHISYSVDLVSININVKKNQIEIVTDELLKDSDGVVLADNRNTKYIIQDMPRVIEYDTDSNGLMIEDSVEEVQPENLSVTDWDTQLGKTIIGAAETFLKSVKGVE